MMMKDIAALALITGTVKELYGRVLMAINGDKPSSPDPKRVKANSHDNETYSSDSSFILLQKLLFSFSICVVFSSQMGQCLAVFFGLYASCLCVALAAIHFSLDSG